MVKKRIQAIWQAGLEDFAARRERAEALRASVAHESAASPKRKVPDRAMEEQVRLAVVAATAPLRQEVESLKQEVDGLRAQVVKLKKAR
jgi:polyhydroxyalkanoate synthesis regulator phasin